VFTVTLACIKKMKNIFYIITIFLLITVSCNQRKKEPNNQYYIEKKLSFFDPYEIIYANGKYKGNTYKKWIRKPDNLIMLHETFKKIGYKKLFSRFDHTNWCGFYLDVSKPTEELVDSLILTFKADNIESKYYREFWNRRKIEQNDSVIFKILHEVSSIVYSDSVISFNDTFANDTLMQLIEIREFEDSLTDTKAIQKQIGLHNSAFNLLYERYRYYDINWNQEELKQGLKTDTIKCCPWAFIEDDTK